MYPEYFYWEFFLFSNFRCIFLRNFFDDLGNIIGELFPLITWFYCDKLKVYIRKRWQQYTEEWYKKDLHDPDNHDVVITGLEPDILECEVKWALGSLTMNKARGGDGIQVELFQILKDNAVKVLHSICQQIWKTQQWP